VCSELVRVAKAGYVEIPSRLWEQSRGLERDIVGLSHHRWLIEVQGDHVRFLPKYHALHGHSARSFPASFLKTISPTDQFTWLFWQGAFTFEEVSIHGLESIREELSRFAADRYDHGWVTRAAESSRESLSWASALPRRVARRLLRRIALK